MSDDDDDYMSDKYLPQNSDVKPGLLFTHTLKKQFARDVKHKTSNASSRIISKKVLEEERRSEGLNKALPEDNKGFAMLQKMGYKPGMAIGKKGDGKTEPIPINVKGDRGGLGRDTIIKRNLEEKKKALENFRSKRLKLEEFNQVEFRNQMRNKATERQLMSDLRKSQKICQQLDTDNSILEPEQDYFWLKPEKDEEDESDEEESDSEDEGEELDPAFMLQKVTEYLRSNHKYCIWCGIKFEDDTDLNTNCPGNTADDH